MSRIPKAKLVELILKDIEEDAIKSFFRIGNETDLKNRLNSFTNDKLRTIIEVGSNIDVDTKRASTEFPLRTSPTLFLVRTSQITLDSTLIKNLNQVITNEGVTKRYLPGNTQAIRSVYIIESIKEILKSPKVYEIEICYEKKIDYVECNNNDPSFGETKKIYSLEKALFWIPKNYPYWGIIATCDFSSLNPIIQFLRDYLSINAYLPDLSQEMLFKIASTAKIRNATFGLDINQKDKLIDAKSLTIFDDNLSEKEVYKRVSIIREQRAGYYTEHPDFLRAGVGISRRYGRIWTPAHLSRTELVRLSLGIIKSVNKELIHVGKSNIPDIIKFHGNLIVKIKDIRLKGNARKAFDSLIGKMEYAKGMSSKKIQVDPLFLKELVLNQSSLDLNVNISIECENCGIQLLQCEECEKMLNVITDENGFHAICKDCKRTYNKAEFTCSCGTSQLIPDLLPDIFITPNIGIIEAIKEYYKSLHPQLDYPGSFIIINQELHLLELQPSKIGIINLSDLSYWKNTAKIDTCQDFSNKDYSKILSELKEKCIKYNYHPSSSDCALCGALEITPATIENLCLLRVFGIPINQFFDGIHNGGEKADIYYDDYYEMEKVKIGIHVKSMSERKYKKGLGRSDNKIKGLYAQVFYSLYQQKIGRVKFDIIGIAIPNEIAKDVKDSLSAIVLELGLGFISVERNDWLSIIESSFATSSMNSI